MVIFKSKQNRFQGDLKIKLCSIRLYPNKNVKYCTWVWKLIQILVGNIIFGKIQCFPF